LATPLYKAFLVGMEKFIRVEQLLGKKATRLLSCSSVAIFGLGAVGSFAAEALARSGVGRFDLVDFDEVHYSNFNRQLLALESTLGRPKAELARERILEINPDCKVVSHIVFAGPENFSRLLSPGPSVVIDAIDSLGPKADLLEFCLKAGIPVVSSMGSGARTDPFSVRLGDIAEVRVCPLARRLKKRLKKKGISKGICCVYSQQATLKNRIAPRKEAGELLRGRERVPVGTLAYMSGIFGLIAAYAAMEIMLSRQRRGDRKENRIYGAGTF